MDIVKTTRLVVTAALAVATVAFAAPADAVTGCGGSSVVGYRPVRGTDTPFGISAGPGGMWYADGNLLVQVRGGQQTAFPLPGHADAGWLAWAGGNAPLWFADRGQGRIGTIDAAGTVVEHQIPAGVNGAAVPQSLVFGPGRTVWFTDQANNRIGRLNLATGGFSFYGTPAVQDPLGMVRGADGALYFTERSVATIGRLGPDGSLTFVTLAAGSFPNRIVLAPDGNVWFTELAGRRLGRITPAGDLTEYPVYGGPVGITVGTDGLLYVALWKSQQVAQVGLDGAVRGKITVPGALQVGTAPDGSIWATDPFADSVAQVYVSCS